MESRRFLASLLIGTAFAWGARQTATVEEAANRAEQLAAQTTVTLRPAFRILAAQALKDRYPQLAEKFVRAALEDVRSRDTIDPELLSALATVAPEETIALLPHLKPGSNGIVINALLRSDQVRRAAALYRASLGNGQPRVDMIALFRLLAKENPEEAKKLFADMMAAFSFEAATPNDLYSLINCAVAIAPVAPGLAADVYERVITLVSAPDYEKKSGFSATFQIGSSKIITQNPRETLLVAAGARLHALAPDRFEKHKDILAKWDLTGAWKSMMPSALGATATPSAERAISDKMGHLRGMSDAERAKAVLELAQEIEALPKGSKLGWASSLANLATEGDNGKEAMNAVAAALGQGIQEGAPSARGYIELATLIRYEHTRAPFADPALDAADAVLALRERVYQGNGFTLT
jgi:hypothetical protein